MNGSILATYSLHDDLFLLCLKGKHYEISALITFSDFVSSYRPVARGGHRGAHFLRQKMKKIKRRKRKIKEKKDKRGENCHDTSLFYQFFLS